LGISSASELVDVFKMKEKENYSQFNYVRELVDQNNTLEEKIRTTREEIEQRKRQIEEDKEMKAKIKEQMKYARDENGKMKA